MKEATSDQKKSTTPASKTGTPDPQSLEARLAALPYPALPSEMESRVRARLQEEMATTRNPMSGEFPFFFRRYQATSAQQFAWTIAFLALAFSFLTYQLYTYSTRNSTNSCHTHETSGKKSDSGTLSAGTTSKHFCPDCTSNKF